MREWMRRVAREVCPENKGDFQNINLSGGTDTTN